MKIVVFGATGIAGRSVVNEALSRGHEVSVLTRDSASVKVRHSRLRVLVGNVMHRDVVVRALEGKDAVIQTLGIGGKGDGRPTTFVSEANSIIMEAMKQQGVRRLIAISVIGAGDSMRFLPWAYRKLFLPLCQKWFQAIIDDKNRMEPAIWESGLDWTVVRCTTIKDGAAKGHVCATLDGRGLHLVLWLPIWPLLWWGNSRMTGT